MIGTRQSSHSWIPRKCKVPSGLIEPLLGVVMAKRILIIILIYACTVAAWVILGKTVNLRTAQQDEKLTDSVGSLWGTSHAQQSPSISFEEKGKEEITRHSIPLDASDITVDLHLEQRKKGLLWYST